MGHPTNAVFPATAPFYVYKKYIFRYKAQTKAPTKNSKYPIWTQKIMLNTNLQ